MKQQLMKYTGQCPEEKSFYSGGLWDMEAYGSVLACQPRTDSNSVLWGFYWGYYYKGTTGYIIVCWQLTQPPASPLPGGQGMELKVPNFIWYFSFSEFTEYDNL